MHYESHRSLIDLATALIEAVGEYYEASLRIFNIPSSSPFLLRNEYYQVQYNCIPHLYINKMV